MSKVIAIVSFKLPQPQTLDQAAATFQTTAPRYLNMPGLLRKNYFLTEDGMRAGAFICGSHGRRPSACIRQSGKPSSGANTATIQRSSTSTRRCWWTTSRAGSSAFEPALLPAVALRPWSRSISAGASRMACPDAACGYVHWDNPIPVVAAIVEHEGRVILARNRACRRRCTAWSPAFSSAASRRSRAWRAK